MKMAHISECQATECGYNKSGTCHALAITVGGIGDHNCDTYCSCGTKGGISSAVGTVGACKVTDCIYNTGLECSMENIKVGVQQGCVSCLSYQPS